MFEPISDECEGCLDLNTAQSAGVDFLYVIQKEKNAKVLKTVFENAVEIWLKYPLGVKILAPPSGHYLQLFTPSSVAERGAMVVGGVIDRDYKGQLFCIMRHAKDHHGWAGPITQGKKICQGVWIKYDQAVCCVVEGGGQRRGYDVAVEEV